MTAPNVRFPTEQSGLPASKEPWCPAQIADWDYSKEYVTVDFGCSQTVRKVEGRDSHTLWYAGEFSNDKKKWKILTSKDVTYNKKEKVSITTKAIIHPLSEPLSVNRTKIPCAPHSN